MVRKVSQYTQDMLSGKIHDRIVVTLIVWSVALMPDESRGECADVYWGVRES